MVEIKAFFDSATSTVSYLVWDPGTLDAAIIDPILDYDPSAGRLTHTSIETVLDEAMAKSLNIVWALDTHAHADHLSGAEYVRSKTGAQIGIGAQITDVQEAFSPLFRAEDVPPYGQAFDALFEDNDTFSIGTLNVTVMHTPGHTPACVTYLIDDAAFVGDTLFMPDFGTARTDFPGGDATTLYRSARRILTLPPETRVFVGHDYLPEGRNHFAWETTVAIQRAENVHIHDGVSEKAFVKMRQKRDATLGAPRLILPSLQVNIRGGALPPQETDGQVYLKIPVNRL